MSDESFGFLMTENEKSGVRPQNLPTEISWLKNKIAGLEELLVKKPSKIKEIRDCERQLRETEYNLLGVKPNRMSKEGVWYCSWLHPEQKEPVGIIVTKKTGVVTDREIQFDWRLKVGDDIIEYVPYFHGVQIYRDYPYCEAKKILMSARKSANAWIERHHTI